MILFTNALLLALIADWPGPKNASISDLETSLHTAIDPDLGDPAFGSTDGTQEASQRYQVDPPYRVFLRLNPHDVPDHLLLAVILAGSTSRSPVDVAQELLYRSGGISRLDTPSVFQSVPGVGDAARARVLAATELARRIEVLRASYDQTTITSAAAAAKVLSTLSTGPYEKLSALYLDRRNRVVGYRTLTIGSDGFTIVDPRQILRPAIELRAISLILAHQHPSGDPTPSEQDIEVTKRVSSAGNILGVRLLDHIVMGSRGRFQSLAELGYLPPTRTQPGWVQ